MTSSVRCGDSKRAALIGDLLSVLLAPYDDMGDFTGRVRVAVRKMNVGEASATTLALVVHELATNSLKYGALSVTSGTLDVSCHSDDGDVVIVWTESGGPPVVAPTGEGGFGSKLIRRGISGQLGGTIAFDWSKEGLVVTLRIDKDRLAH